MGLAVCRLSEPFQLEFLWILHYTWLIQSLAIELDLEPFSLPWKSRGEVESSIPLTTWLSSQAPALILKVFTKIISLKLTQVERHLL